MSFIILDRDGVINYNSSEYIKSPEEWHAIPGSLEAIAQLNQHGFHVLVATNQSGIGRGYYTVETLERIHKKMCTELAACGGRIKDFFICPHHPEDQCACRKPKPGLLYQIQQKYLLNLSETFFIGDSLVDVEAAQTAGCIPLFINSHATQTTAQDHPVLNQILSFTDLMAAVNYVLDGKKVIHE